MPTHTLQAVVLETVVDAAVLIWFQEQNVKYFFESLKARNHFAVGCRMDVIISESNSAGQCDWLGTNILGKACSGGELSKHFLPFVPIIIEVFV